MGGYYEPQDRRSVSLSLRVSPYVKTGLEKIARLWTMIDRAYHGDEEISVSVPDVVSRLLSVGIRGVWGQLDYPEPMNEADWAELEKRIPELARRTSKL